jgi:hypothetical protein
MQNFTAHRLTFITEARSTVELNEHQGSAIRGALFHALRRNFCAFARDRAMHCERCALVKTCPVALLVSTLDRGHPRGQNRPRPYTIQPPLFGGDMDGVRGRAGHPVELDDGRLVFHYEPGEILAFGLTLYADAMTLFPYVVLAVGEFERGGLGRRTPQADGRWRRGTLHVQSVWASNPLNGERQPVVREGTSQVHVPDVPITHAQIEASKGPPNTRVTVNFLTPTRLIESGHLVKPEDFRFRSLFQRLLERLEALSEDFSDPPLDVDFPALLEKAEAVRVVDNRLHWEELRSYSTRRHSSTPTGGLMGRVMLETQDWALLWPWLRWGQFVHVGKDAVKGNGWYRVMAEDRPVG